jgi:hypothetical protein
MSTELAALYRVRAAQCVDLALRVSDSKSKLSLLQMAQSWVMLADHTENALVHETPETPQQVAQQQQQPQPDDPETKG